MNFWQGERIKLRGVEPGDAELFSAWNEDLEMLRMSDRITPPLSRERMRQWTARQAERDEGADAMYLLMEAEGGEVVGNINTYLCDRRVGSFKLGFVVSPGHRRRGYASEAVVMVLRYFFEELRYQKANADAYSHNPASIALSEKLGFVIEGRLRRTAFTQGRHSDRVLFGMTREEFHALYGMSA